MSAPQTMTVLEFATSLLNHLGIDPDATVKVREDGPVEAWQVVAEKILDAVDELETLLSLPRRNVND